MALRKAVLLTAMLGAALSAQTGAALASEGHHGSDDQRGGVANVQDTESVVPTDACANDVPVNVVGVQVPIQDVAGNVPLGSPSDDGGGNASGIDKRCGHDVDTDTDR